MMKEKSNPELIVIVGPTASGKTELGIRLAQRVGGAIVSADSRQIYAGMDVGTATPRRSGSAGGYGGQEPHDILVPDVVDGVDHFLLNIREPNDEMTLSQWQAAAFEVVDKLLGEGRTPILVGGTMLYVDSLVFNYAIPEVPENKKLREKLERRPVEKLYADLLTRDPGAKKFIEAGNTRRIVRALEVMAATGQPFSELRRRQEPRYDVTVIGLFDDWDALRDRIKSRVHKMIGAGLVQETKNLIERYGRELPLLQTLNYRQASKMIDGDMTEAEAADDMVRSTLRYARRQMSWWRGREDITWYGALSEAVASR